MDMHQTIPPQLRQIIDSHQACYEVWPDWALVNGRRVQVGFEVDLCATVAQPGDGPSVETYLELQQVAMFVLPHDPDEVEIDVMPFDNSLHESSWRNFRPETVLALRILHKHGFEQPVDDSEERCLRLIENALQQLGIRRASK
jgi:hypothetical protein